MNDNRSLFHGTWTRAMNDLADEEPEGTDLNTVARFCAEVLKRCESTPELREYLDAQGAKAMGDE